MSNASMRCGVKLDEVKHIVNTHFPPLSIACIESQNEIPFKDLGEDFKWEEVSQGISNVHHVIWGIKRLSNNTISKLLEKSQCEQQCDELTIPKQTLKSRPFFKSP
jgi:hypothetical protein